MDAYEFSPLPEEFTPPVEEGPPPQESFLLPEPALPAEYVPHPEEFPMIRPPIEGSKEKSVLRKLKMLSATFAVGSMLFGVFASGEISLPGNPAPLIPEPPAVTESNSAPEPATGFHDPEVSIRDDNTIIPHTIEREPQALPQSEELYYPREYTVTPLGDRELKIIVIDNGNIDFVYGPNGDFLGTRDVILLEAAMKEQDFSDMVLPLPEIPEGFIFLGYVMHAKGGSEEDPMEYTEFVATELTTEKISHAPILTWADPETGETHEGRYLEFIGMWLCTEEEDRYLLTLDANGGEYLNGEAGKSTTDATYNVRSPLYSSTMCLVSAFPEPVRRGYRFTGWYRTPEADGEAIEIVNGDEFYPLRDIESGINMTMEEFDAQFDFTAEDFDWDAYFTALGEVMGNQGDRDWSTVIPVTLYAGWERVET